LEKLKIRWEIRAMNLRKRLEEKGRQFDEKVLS